MTAATPPPATCKIPQTAPAWAPGHLTVGAPDPATGVATVTARATGCLVGTIAADGIDHTATHHTGTATRPDWNRSRVLAELATIHNNHIDALRAAR